MVSDDLGGSQSEDPLPCRTDPAHLSTAASSAVSRQAENAAPRAAPLPPPVPLPDLAAENASTGRVPLWDRLPRSIWLMSSLLMLPLQLLP